MNKNHLLAIMTAYCCITTFALADKQNRFMTAPKLGEKEGWLTAPALLPANTKWLKANPIASNVVGFSTK